MCKAQRTSKNNTVSSCEAPSPPDHLPRGEGSFSRRELLARSAAGMAAFTAATCRFSPLLAAPASRWFKIGVCEWLTGKAFDLAVFDLVKTIGLDGLQLEVRSATDKHLNQPELQQKYLAAAKCAGVEISSLALGPLNSVPLKSDPRALAWVEESIDVCKAMGLTVILLPFFGAGDIDMQRTAEIDHVVKVLRQAAPKAEKQGVVVGPGKLPDRRRQHPPDHRPRRFAGGEGLLRRGQLDRQGPQRDTRKSARWAS